MYSCLSSTQTVAITPAELQRLLSLKVSYYIHFLFSFLCESHQLPISLLRFLSLPPLSFSLCFFEIGSHDVALELTLIDPADPEFTDPCLFLPTAGIKGADHHVCPSSLLYALSSMVSPSLG